MAVAVEFPLIVRGVVEPKLRVGGATAPAGLEVIAAVRVTLPVNPPAGVMVMVEVFPVVAPGATETAVPLMVKPGGGRSITYVAEATGPGESPGAMAMA